MPCGWQGGQPVRTRRRWAVLTGGSHLPLQPGPTRAAPSQMWKPRLRGCSGEVAWEFRRRPRACSSAGGLRGCMGFEGPWTTQVPRLQRATQAAPPRGTLCRQADKTPPKKGALRGLLPSLGLSVPISLSWGRTGVPETGRDSGAHGTLWARTATVAGTRPLFGGQDLNYRP